MPVVKPDRNGHSLGSSRIAIPAADPLVSALDHSGAAQDRHEPQNGFRSVRCGAMCAVDGGTERHHNRLTAIEYDPDVLLELMELAVTWPELEYSESDTIPPDSWMAFVAGHRWADPDRVTRIFSIATDIVMTSTRASRRLESWEFHESWEFRVCR